MGILPLHFGTGHYFVFVQRLAFNVFSNCNPGVYNLLTMPIIKFVPQLLAHILPSLC